MTTIPTTKKERPKRFLVEEYCKGCGRCIDSCNKHCITAGTEIDPLTGLIPVNLDLETCNGCGLCIDACPEPYGLTAKPDYVTAAEFELLDPEKMFGTRLQTAPPPTDIPDETIPLPQLQPLVIKGTYASA